MDTKGRSGNRITAARKKMGITIKELASRTEVLSAARISNWEQGTRNPGPEEAKLLANILDVAASYLLGITDNPEGELRFPGDSSLQSIPLIDIDEINPEQPFEQITEKKVIIDRHNKEAVFALTINDTSMQPDFMPGDLIIVNTKAHAKPGDYVLAYLPAKNQHIFRKYAEMGDSLYQLLASNNLWAAINIKNEADAKIIGVAVEHRRYL
jgi:SOS-response transcriptional repressor LexA